MKQFAIAVCVLAATACSNSGSGDDGGGVDLVPAPDACASGMLAYATDLDGATSASGSIAISTGFIFGNKVGSDPGEMLIGGTNADTALVSVFFDHLVVDGGTVPARGAVNLPDIGAVGADCATEQLVGTITVGKGDPKTYKFQLTNLRAGGACDAPIIAGGFSGCYSD